MSAVNLVFGGLGVVVVVAWVVVVPWRRGIRRSSATPRGLHPYEVAYLRRGRDPAISAALGALRVGQVLGCAEPQSRSTRMKVIGSPRWALTPLDEAVMAAGGSQAGGFRFGTVSGDGRVQAVLDQIQSGLERDGLALGRGARRHLRVAALPLLLAPVAFCTLWWAVSAPTVPADVPGKVLAVSVALAAQGTVLVALMMIFGEISRASSAGDTAVAAAKAHLKALRQNGQGPHDPGHAALRIAMGEENVAGIERPFALAAKIYVPSSD